MRRFSYIHDTKLFPFVKNPNFHRPEIGLKNPFVRSDVAIEMEKPPPAIANSQLCRTGFSNLRDERFSFGFFAIGNSKQFPERDEVVARSSEIGAEKNARVRHPLPRPPDGRGSLVGNRESYRGERGRIFEFPARGIRMVDIAPARSQGRAGVFVPIEKIKRERKCRNSRILTFRTFGRAHEKLAFARRKIRTESPGKIGRNVVFPAFVPDGEFDRGRIDLFRCGVGQISKTENAAIHRVPASKPESAGFAVSRHGVGVFELPVHGGGVAIRHFENPHLSELFAFRGFAKNRRLVIRVFERFSKILPKFVLSAVRGCGL